jgi:hypothetical protein
MQPPPVADPIQNWLSPQSLTMIQEADEQCEKDATLAEGGTFLNKLASKAANYDGGVGMAFESAQQTQYDQQPNNCLTTSFEMRNPIDLSIDPTRHTQNEIPMPSPTNAGFSRITGI